MKIKHLYKCIFIINVYLHALIKKIFLDSTRFALTIKNPIKSEFFWQLHRVRQKYCKITNTIIWYWSFSVIWRVFCEKKTTVLFCNITGFYIKREKSVKNNCMSIFSVVIYEQMLCFYEYNSIMFFIKAPLSCIAHVIVSCPRTKIWLVSTRQKYL